MTAKDRPAGGTAATVARIALWALVLAWAGVIFWFSSQPGSAIPGRYSEEGHLGEYFIFGALLYLALRRDISPARAAGIAIVVASLYGMSDEFHQHFTPGRTPDVIDWASDTLGASVAVGSALIARRILRRQ